MPSSCYSIEDRVIVSDLGHYDVRMKRLLFKDMFHRVEPDRAVVMLRELADAIEDRLDTDTRQEVSVMDLLQQRYLGWL